MGMELQLGQEPEGGPLLVVCNPKSEGMLASVCCPCAEGMLECADSVLAGGYYIVHVLQHNDPRPEW